MRDAVKLVVVLGHSQCGAVSAAVDAFLDPKKYLSLALSHALRSIVDRLFISVQTAAKALETAWGDGIWYETGLRPALIEMAVALNAGLAAYTLNKELSDRSADELQAVYGVYDLATREVGLPLTEHPEIELRCPPKTRAGVHAVRFPTRPGAHHQAAAAQQALTACGIVCVMALVCRRPPTPPRMLRDPRDAHPPLDARRRRS